MEDFDIKTNGSKRQHAVSLAFRIATRTSFRLRRTSPVFFIFSASTQRKAKITPTTYNIMQSPWLAVLGQKLGPTFFFALLATSTITSTVTVLEYQQKEMFLFAAFPMMFLHVYYMT